MPNAPQTPLALAEAIRQIRRREKMTQEDLAAKANVHPTWVSRLERGDRDPRFSSIQKIALGLGVSPLELVALAERIELD